MRMLICSSVPLLLVVAFSSTLARAADTKAYELKDSECTFAAPSTWKERPGKSQLPEVILTVDAKVPAGTALPTFTVVADGKTEFKESNLADDTKATQDRMKKNSPDVTFGKTEEVTLDGVKALRFSFTKKVKDTAVSGMRLIAIRHKRLYVIGFSADQATHDAKLADVNKVIDSFQWTDVKR